MPTIPDNPQPTESSKPLLEQTPAERRLRLLPLALANQSSISEGQELYLQYLQAKKILLENSSNRSALYIVNDFDARLFRNGKVNIQSYEENVGRPEIIKARRYDEDTVSQIEIATTESIATGYGIFSQAVEARDVTTCVSLLNCFPDLSFHPQICQQLETVVAEQLSDPEFFKNITSQVAKNPDGFGTLDTVGYLYQSYFADLPSDESISHLDPIYQLTTIARGANIQNEIESDKHKALGGKSMGKRLQEYQSRLNTLWTFQDSRENLNKMVGILGQQIDLDFDDKRPSDLPGLLPDEHYAYSIAQLTKADFFNDLPANIQQDIKLHLLGNLVGLAQHAVEAASNSQVNTAFTDNRINVIAALLEPIITSGNLPTENPKDLQNLEATAIWQIYSTLGTESPQYRQLKQKLEAIAAHKPQSSSPVEIQPQPDEPQVEAVTKPEIVESTATESVAPLETEPEVAQPTVETTAPTEKPHQSEATAEQLYLVAKFIAELPNYKRFATGTRPEEVVNLIHGLRRAELNNLSDTDPLIILLEMTQNEIRKKY